MSTLSNCRECNRVTRQAHLVAAVMVWTSLLMAITVSYNWIWLSALPGFGLLLDATTGVCPMTLLLGRMPWNSIRKPS